MATSGSYDFTMSRDELIVAAFRLAGMRESLTPSPDDIIHVSRALNMMLKSWQNEGIDLWLQRTATLYPAYGTASYSLGASGTHCTLSPVATTLGAAAVAGATSLTVASITGIATTYNIGIELDDGTRQWTTVNGAPSGTTVALAAALTGAAASGNTVKVYQTKAQRPLRIVEARWRNSSGDDTNLDVVNRDDYMGQTDKTTVGTPNMVYYDTQLTSGVLYVWSPPDDVTGLIVMTVVYPIQDMDAAADNFEIPGEWLRAVMYNLAAEIALMYPESVPERSLVIITERARIEKATANHSNAEQSVQFVPDTRE